jgi:hypothetical protein
MLAFFVVFVVVSVFLASAQALPSYKIWCVGNCDRDVVPDSTIPGVVLMGGGVSRNISAFFFFFLSSFPLPRLIPMKRLCGSQLMLIMAILL